MRTCAPTATRRSPRCSAARSSASTPSSTRSPPAPRRRALKIHITGEVRDRARNGRYAFVHDRGRDFAAGIWVVDPAFMLDLAHAQLDADDTAPAREEAYFAGARLDDDELRAAAADDEKRRAQARARHADATRANLGLGHDIRAGLIEPTDAQLDALRQIVCRLLVRHYGELIAYGAGWTDPERQRPVGDTGRHEPRHVDAIIDAELDRALADPDPLRGIAQLTARWAAAFVLDPAGVTRTKALGTERMARKLRDALPGGEGALRAAVWEFMRPMLSPGAGRAEPRRVRPRRAASRRPSTSTATARRPTSTTWPSTSEPTPRPRRSLRSARHPLARGSSPGREEGGRVTSRLPLFRLVVDPARGIGVRTTPGPPRAAS